VRVLVGCEESGYIRSEFRRFGHDAWSCDLEPAADGSPHHYECDIMQAIQYPYHGQPWDLIICHPPCTYMAVSGNRWHAGTKEREGAIAWTRKLWRAAMSAAPRVCFEQPVSVLNVGPRRQTVQPWMFGVMESKATVLHLYNLPKLVPWREEKPDNLSERVWKMGPSEQRSRMRGHLPWLARPMAEQWGAL